MLTICDELNTYLDIEASILLKSSGKFKDHMPPQIKIDNNRTDLQGIQKVDSFNIMEHYRLLCKLGWATILTF